MPSPVRILLAKVGLDGHDRGIQVIARALKAAGMEVWYTGLHRTAREVAQQAKAHGVQVVAVSSLTGAHLTIFPSVLEALRDEGLAGVSLIAGGIIPAADHERLVAVGVEKIFEPGATTDDIVGYLRTRFHASGR